MPRTTLAARLVGHLQGGVALSSGRGCRPPSSLPDAVHGPAMPRPTAPPTVGARPALRAGLRPANSLPSSAPSIDLTSCALRMYSACLDRGRGEVERVTTTSFPSDPETGARSAAVRAQACPAPSSLLVLQDARSGAWPRPQDVVAACPTSLPEPLHEPAVPRPTAAPNCGHEISPTSCSASRQLPAYEPAFHRSHIVRSACTVRVWIGAVARSSPSPRWPSAAHPPRCLGSPTNLPWPGPRLRQP